MYNYTPQVILQDYAAAPIFQIVKAIVMTLQWAIIGVSALGPIPLYQSWKFETLPPPEEHRPIRRYEAPPRRPMRPEDINVPAWVADWQDKRWVWAVAAFFLGNLVKQAVVASGALEVFYGNNLLHSTVKTGRYPDAARLVEALKRIKP